MSSDVNLLLDRQIEAFPAYFDLATPETLKIGLGKELLALAGVHDGQPASAVMPEQQTFARMPRLKPRPNRPRHRDTLR